MLRQGSNGRRGNCYSFLSLNRAAKEAKKAKQATKKTAVSAAKVRCSGWIEIIKWNMPCWKSLLLHCLMGNYHLDLEAPWPNFGTKQLNTMSLILTEEINTVKQLLDHMSEILKG